MGDSSFLNPTDVVRSAGVEEGMLVADFGAGSGFFTRAAARAVGPSGVVWAVDINQELLPRLKNLSLAEGLKNVEVVHGDIEKEKGSKLPSDHFDAVIITNVLFGSEHRDAVAAEAARVLKKGGKALVVDWQDSFGGLGPHPSHVITQTHVQKLFEDHGFTFLREVAAGAYHWGIIMRKQA